MVIVKATGDKKHGIRVNVPWDAFCNADQPKEYDCVTFQDGTLVYQPVKP